jgi:hypothetical protein
MTRAAHEIRTTGMAGGLEQTGRAPFQRGTSPTRVAGVREARHGAVHPRSTPASFPSMTEGDR